MSCETRYIIVRKVLMPDWETVVFYGVLLGILVNGLNVE